MEVPFLNLKNGGPQIPTPPIGPEVKRGKTLQSEIRELAEEIQMIQDQVKDPSFKNQKSSLEWKLRNLILQKTIRQRKLDKLLDEHPNIQASLEAPNNVKGSARNRGTFRRRRASRRKSRKNRN